MLRRSAGATSALLQKANSQLKGERVKKPEDELDAYISSLTQKTSQQQKSVNFDDVHDGISISSDLEDLTPRRPEISAAPTSGSKFLKKKPGSADQGVASVSKFVKKPEPSTASPAPAVRTQTQYVSRSAGSQPGLSGQGAGRLSQASSALSKASALTGKIQDRAASRRTMAPESDSDDSFSALKLARSSGEQLSESVTTDSIKIGRGGGKFLKKSTPVPAPTQSVEVPQTSLTQSGRDWSPDKHAHPQQKKVAPYTLKSSLKYSTDVVLTSEEESLAEYVGGLPSSSGDSWERERYKKQLGRRGAARHTPSPPCTPPPAHPTRRSPSPPRPVRSPRRQSSGRPTTPNKPPMARRTPSPSPRGSSGSPYLRRRSASPKLQKSYSDDSNVAESIQSEIAEDYDFGGNIIMDIEELDIEEPKREPSPRPETPTSRSESPFRATARKTKKETKKTRKSALKSASQTSVTDSKKARETSPFKSSDKDRESSPFKATDQPRGKSPFKSSNEKTGSSFKSGNYSPFRTTENSSPFRAKDPASSSKPKSEPSPSPFRSSNEGSVFKVENKENKKSKHSKKQTSGDAFKATENLKPVDSRGSSPFKSSKTEKKSKKGKSKKSTEKKAKDEVSDLFGSFGVQTIEDLLGQSAKESEYESVTFEAKETDDVHSEVSEEIQTEKPGMYSYSRRFEESVTEIVTVVDTHNSVPSYTEDVDSISEKIGYTGGDRARSSLSDIRTHLSGDETVPDYTEFDESDTETVTSTGSSDQYKTYSDYSSYTEDFTKSLVPTRSDMTPVPRSGMRNTEVQTSIDPSLQFQWDPRFSGLSFPGVPLGMGFVDPTPIAVHVVSADALEAMTAYSPAMLALHDMLKSQMELTREFLHTQQRLYADFASRVEPTFHYTTLEDTKNYIKKHRKKRLTFKEALKLVDREMGR